MDCLLQENFTDEKMDIEMEIDLALAWSLCRNLRSVRITTACSREIDAFLRYPIENPKSLHLGLIG